MVVMVLMSEVVARWRRSELRCCPGDNLRLVPLHRFPVVHTSPVGFFLMELRFMRSERAASPRLFLFAISEHLSWGDPLSPPFSRGHKARVRLGATEMRDALRARLVERGQ